MIMTCKIVAPEPGRYIQQYHSDKNPFEYTIKIPDFEVPVAMWIEVKAIDPNTLAATFDEYMEWPGGSPEVSRLNATTKLNTLMTELMNGHLVCEGSLAPFNVHLTTLFGRVIQVEYGREPTPMIFNAEL